VWAGSGIVGSLLIYVGVWKRNNRVFSLGLVLFGVALAFTGFCLASQAGWWLGAEFELSGKQKFGRLLLDIAGGIGAGIAVLGLMGTWSKVLFFKRSHALDQPSDIASQPSPARKLFARSSLKTLVTSVVVVVVVSLVLNVLIYTQPLSRIEVIVVSDYLDLSVEVRVYLDDKLKAVVAVNGGRTVVGEWPVKTGIHLVAIDHGTWEGEWSGGEWFHYADGYSGPDGIIDYAHEYRVEPLDPEDIYIHIFLPQ